jgi:hypothetical protein
MARCNPTMYPGGAGCPTLAAALISAGIAGVGDAECMKDCSGCVSRKPVAHLRLVPSSAEPESSSPRHLK